VGDRSSSGRPFLCPDRKDYESAVHWLNSFKDTKAPFMSIALPETISGESEIDHQCIHATPASSAVDSPAITPEVDFNAINGAVRTILKAVGEDPDRDGLLDTPRRVAKMYAEMFSGLHLNPGRHLDVTFEESYDEIVLVRDIEFTSMCEHHLLPFRGVAHVAYVPNGRVTGLSKLARVVEEVSRRPQVQERMTQTVADLIEDRLGSSAVGVIVKAEHSCMSIRGIRKPGSMTVTSSMRGSFRNDPASRAELMSLINQ
jgi:GTP cyclohydrolase IA